MLRSGTGSATSQAGARPARHKVFEPVAVTVAGAEARAHLLNVSAGGALLHVLPAVRRGDRLAIRIRGEWREARVVRADGPRAGVAFDRALDAALVAQLLL